MVMVALLLLFDSPVDSPVVVADYGVGCIAVGAAVAVAVAVAGLPLLTLLSLLWPHTATRAFGHVGVAAQQTRGL